MTQREADYRRIARELADAIESGRMKSGTMLPKIDVIATQEGVSRSTVQRALMLLSDRGLIEGHQGKGVYVAERHS